ncbi:MAG: hypothetical protein JEY71_02175 [Sphaerochaeta sp.]|nr:hypothetical protein [Sphaerochaeta sp.]
MQARLIRWFKSVCFSGDAVGMKNPGASEELQHIILGFLTLPIPALSCGA